MSEVTETDMANTALMLDEAVTKRIAVAIMGLLTRGATYPVPEIIDIDGSTTLDSYTLRHHLSGAIIDCIKDDLIGIIENEIVAREANNALREQKTTIQERVPTTES